MTLSALVSSAALAQATHSPENEEAIAAEAAEQITLQSLLEAFAGMSGLEASFVEEKSIAMLAAPLESRGTLYFARPGFMLRRIDAPRNGEVLVTPDRLVVSEGGEVAQVFDLRSREDVARFVESFIWILAGNHEALARAYEIRFEVSEVEPDAWTMTLIPNNERLGQVIQQIEVKGTKLNVERITVTEATGDQTVTRIVDANPERTFSDEEFIELFGQPAE